MDFEKLLGEQIFKNHNCIPFLSSRQCVHPCFLLYFALLVIPYLNVLSFYFNVSLSFFFG